MGWWTRFGRSHRPSNPSRDGGMLPPMQRRASPDTEPRRGRSPFWSGFLTGPLASVVPARWRGGVLVAIKAFHTGIFLSIFAALLLALWDGLRARPGPRTAIAGAVVLAETAVYVSNNQVCPLTPLAEELGAARGSVVDIFLPPPVARHIPLVSGSAALLALLLNLRALRRSSSLPSRRHCCTAPWASAR